MRIGRAWAVVVTLAVIAATINTPTTAADDKLLFGGGAGIVVDGSYCTLTTIGHDRTGELVGFTAAHCGGPGAQVVAEGTDATVGSVVATNSDLHYAVIKFDAAKVTPIPDFAGFVINGIGADPGSFQPVCTQGAATGFGCGFATVAGVKPGAIAANVVAWQPGDDGAPVADDGQLLGMTRRGFFYPINPGVFPGGNANIKVVLFSAILDDVNTTGGPGAEFTPIGS